MPLSPSAFDLPEAAADVIAVMISNMHIKQRSTCALVCSDWAKAAAATTHSIVKHGLRDLKGLQQWLEKNGSQIQTVQLQVDCHSGMARLPCPQLQDLLLHGEYSGCKLPLDSKVWSDIAAATKLTSVSLQRVRTASKQAVVVSALTALPDLLQLTWQDVECEKIQDLADSRLLQHLTKLTGLDLYNVSTEALQHLGSLTKLQHLSISQAPGRVAVKWPGLQQLTALTSLEVDSLEGLPSAVSHLAALQQLTVWDATPTELNGLKALTALTKLCVEELTPDETLIAAPLQLPALKHLDIAVEPWSDKFLLMSQLSSCTQLRQLTLRGLCLMGPRSLVASSMLQELCVEDCSLRRFEGPACKDLRQLFPGPGRLPHLTSLVLRSVSPSPQQSDLERMVACCSELRRLELTAQPSWSLTSASAFECLSQVRNLVSLHLSTVTDQQCSSLAQLTGLQELEVLYQGELSPVGLRHLACLQQMTRLCLAPPGSPPDVSARLLPACDMAAGDQQQ